MGKRKGEEVAWGVQLDSDASCKVSEHGSLSATRRTHPQEVR